MSRPSALLPETLTTSRTASVLRKDFSPQHTEHMLVGRSTALLVSAYPAVSHTFILREVLGLRRLGLHLETASINNDDRPLGQLSAEEQNERAQTFYVKAAGWRGALRSHAAAAFRFPRKYVGGLREALRIRSGGLRGLFYALFYFTEALILGCWMRDRRLSHLHVHFGSAGATVGFLAAHTFGFGYSLTIHGPDEFYDVEHYRLKQKFAAAAFIYCIGSYARSQILRLLPASDWHKVHIARLGVDVTRFTPEDRSKAEAPFRILCVGRLVETKGQAVLVEAVSQLQREGLPVVVHLVGDGPSRESLLELVKAHGLGACVSFAGAVNPESIPDLLRSADAFVLPSFAEGIPVALMEAMSMQVPCITTFVNGIPELIENGVDGLLVPPSDVTALAAAIRKLIGNAELRQRLGQAGRDRVVRQYNLETNTRQLGRIWLKCLNPAEVQS
jgi:colanic acid/amylovoran biosynthesis glycosyltransferase